ncbi:MAG TPA: methyltransferase domain-containing protein [Burkholderiales bacterium]|nr:methyltransferase domain-containing protein [Burkholderiales bacterium]
MTDASRITGHYSSGDLIERLRKSLAEDGADPERPTMEALAPYDHFHGRGIEATDEMARSLHVRASDRLLDVGSGIGGPARYLARRFGCRVSGIDLTPEFCEVARELTRALGLEDRVEFHVGDALAMPFADASFDGAYSMNVSMNIADKPALYREIQRVLKPGGWLVLSEIAQGPGGAPQYPTPWARTAEASFLATREDTERALREDGFDTVQSRSTRAQALAFSERSREAVARGEKPPHRAVQLIHGELAKQAMANMARGTEAHALEPIEILCRKKGPS